MKEKINTEEIELDAPTEKRFKFIISSIFEGRRYLMDKTFSILDLGCSEGYLHGVLVNQFGNNVLGIDFGGYDYGYQMSQPDIVHDLNKYPYPLKDKSCTHIVAGEIIEHLHNPTALIKECYRLLDNYGVLIITTPNGCGMHHALEDPKEANYARPYGHIHCFTEVFLTRLLRYNGFEVMNVDYTYYSKYLPVFLYNKRLGGANIMLKAFKKPKEYH